MKKIITVLLICAIARVTMADDLRPEGRPPESGNADIALTNWTARMTATEQQTAIALTNWIARMTSTESNSSIALTNWNARLGTAEGNITIALTNWTARMDATEQQTTIALTNWLARMSATEGNAITALTNWTARMATAEGNITIALTNWNARVGAAEGNITIALTNWQGRVTALENNWYSKPYMMTYAASQNVVVANGLFQEYAPTNTTTLWYPASDTNYEWRNWIAMNSGASSVTITGLVHLATNPAFRIATDGVTWIGARKAVNTNYWYIWSLNK